MESYFLLQFSYAHPHPMTSLVNIWHSHVRNYALKEPHCFSCLKTSVVKVIILFLALYTLTYVLVACMYTFFLSANPHPCTLPFSPLPCTTHCRHCCEWWGQRGGSGPARHRREEVCSDQQCQQVHHDHPRLKEGDWPRVMPLVQAWDPSMEEYICSGMTSLKCCVGECVYVS